jgi:hypothetical protein
MRHLAEKREFFQDEKEPPYRLMKNARFCFEKLEQPESYKTHGLKADT